MAVHRTKKHSMKHSKKHSKMHSKKSTKKTAADEARCMSCKKNVKVVSSIIKNIKVRGATRKQMVGKGACGHTVYKFVKG